VVPDAEVVAIRALDPSITMSWTVTSMMLLAGQDMENNTSLSFDPERDQAEAKDVRGGFESIIATEVIPNAVSEIYFEGPYVDNHSKVTVAELVAEVLHE
jgi:hypothetical protein